ncbi:MAG: hypothetical protein IKC04_02465, partial [Oscillospiraceae bacterium]|nr:hypothetical protein [Oscillospiraceae bacterium]
GWALPIRLPQAVSKSARSATRKKAPSDEGKRSVVAVVNDSPVDCQSRDRIARRQLSSRLRLD